MIPGIAHVRNALDERTGFLCCCKMVWGGSVSARILRDVGEGAQTWKGAKRLGQVYGSSLFGVRTGVSITRFFKGFSTAGFPA